MKYLILNENIMKKIGFYAYCSNPSEIGSCIESAVLTLNRKSSDIEIKTWKHMDITGHFIANEVLSGIDEADFLIADISVLNLNVTYEIGYAIGKGKRILLTKNSSLSEGQPKIHDVGIFDTLGYKEYVNQQQLSEFLSSGQFNDPIFLEKKLNKQAPVYFVLSKHKTDWISRIESRIKKSRYIFRTFDPSEQPRLSAHEAIHQVSESMGVVIPILSSHIDGFLIHNIRSAFIAGLSKGLDKPHILIQMGHDSAPLDYRDLVKHCYKLDDINEVMADFAGSVAAFFQQENEYSADEYITELQKIDLGSTSAENEMRSLQRYYLKTEQYLKAVRGEANLVVGRKGSGKSAIFLQIRDRERSSNQNLVLDLKPEGYKFVKFKEQILNFLQEGTFQHTIMAFWEYVLLLELCNKILSSDKELHLHNESLYQPYREISELYKAEGYDTEGDFSERMSTLMARISSDYFEKYGENSEIRLSSPQLTELLYKHDIKAITDQLKKYLKYKRNVWLLIDNIDKGWPTSGLQKEDLLIVRALIDCTKKIQRQFSHINNEINIIIFLRNDVYELLVQHTADRGKEGNVLLDWTDTDLLREMVRLRIVANEGFNKDFSFEQAWKKLFVSHFKGEESSQYLIERSLMRPRFLLNLINQCKSFAVNLNHQLISEDDISKGLKAYSTDLLSDISYELNDINNELHDILYSFIGVKSLLSPDELKNIISMDNTFYTISVEVIINILLWYGFVGVCVNGHEIKFIYHFNYNMKLMEGFIKTKIDDITFIINPAFWDALLIEIDKDLAA